MFDLENISAGYSDRNILQNISLRFEEGKVHTIIGRNGCGKSTLLKTCAGLLKPGTGRILLNERDLQQYAPVERAKAISYLSQSRNTPAISVERLVEHGRYPRLSSPRRLNQADRDIIEASMQRMRVDHLRRKNLQELSGGEQQRVYIAMLLAQDTPVMLLDEPTSHMDVEHQLALLEMLRECCRTGKCVIQVLHDLPLALKYSDQLVVMEDGHVSGCASPETILSNGTLEQIFHVKVEAVGSEEKGYVVIRWK